MLCTSSVHKGITSSSENRLHFPIFRGTHNSFSSQLSRIRGEEISDFQKEIEARIYFTTLPECNFVRIFFVIQPNRSFVILSIILFPLLALFYIFMKTYFEGKNIEGVYTAIIIYTLSIHSYFLPHFLEFFKEKNTPPLSSECIAYEICSCLHNLLILQRKWIRNSITNKTLSNTQGY